MTDDPIPDDLSIGFLQSRDIRPLYALLCLRVDPPTLAEWQRTATRAMARRDSGMLVARDLGGRLVGYCLFQRLRSPARRTVLVALDLFAADPISAAPARAALQAQLTRLARRRRGLVAVAA